MSEKDFDWSTWEEERIKKAKLKLYGALRQKPVEKLTDTEIEIQYQLSMDSDVQEFFDKLRKQMNERDRVGDIRMMYSIEKFSGIKIIETPNLPKGHLEVLNGNELSILYPEVYKSFKMLNKLAPDYFNETNVKSYEMVDLGSVNLMPRHHLEIPEPPHGFDPSGPSFPCNIEIKPDFTPDFDFPNIGAMVRKAKKED